jgi:cytochrome P450
VFNCSQVIEIALSEPGLVESAKPPSIANMMKGSLPAVDSFAENRRLRKIYYAAMTPKAIAGYLPVIEKVIDFFLDEFYSRNEPVEVNVYMSALFIDLANTLMFGPMTPDQVSTWRDLGFLIQTGMFSIPDNNATSPYQLGISASDKVRELATPLVKAKIAQIKATGKEPVPTLVGTSLIALKKKGVDLATVRYEDYVNWAPANYLMFLAPLLPGAAMWNLVSTPDFLDALRQEQAELMATSSKLGLSELASLPYVDASFKQETAAGPFAGVGTAMFRRAVQTFEIGGQTIPQGKFMALEHPVCLFQNPDGPVTSLAFTPEAWIDKPSSSGGCPFLRANPLGFIPFGVGARQCVGRYLGSTLYRMTLSLALRKGTWTRADDAPFYDPFFSKLNFTPSPLAPASTPSPACPGMGWWRAQPPRPK